MTRRTPVSGVVLAAVLLASVIDYDRGGYDYRGFWAGRDYEWWAERRVLRRLVAQLGRPRWLVDFGGGFGRNLEHYRDRAERAVIVDYSFENLRRTAEEHRPEMAAGRLLLVRADLNRLPFRDQAFDAALIVRVLHHLPDVDRALGEMGRVVHDRWILDVPIKHHLLARARALRHGDRADLKSTAPRVSGSSDFPFSTFQLGAVRERLSALGFDTTLAASVNNFRRWDRKLPAPMLRALRPVVYGLELAAQRAGRGWWGPSQFVVARRRADTATRGAST